MTIKNTCPTCGSAVQESMRFCQACGTKLKPDTAGDPRAIAQAAACPNCGKAAKAGQRFCAKCGSSLFGEQPARTGMMPRPMAIGQVPGSQVPSAVLAPGQAAAGAAAGDAAAAKMKDMGERSKSALDDFMGRSVDTESVGLGFNPAAHTLKGATEAELKAAFSYFGKSYAAPKPNEGALPIASVVRRAEAEAEMAAQVQAQRDFSKTSGEGAHYGSFAGSLSAVAMPTVGMIEGSRAQAQKNEQVSRLKHKVALGDADMAEAVEQARG